jgi:hypothetical protein
MSATTFGSSSHDIRPEHYEIRIQGYLNPRWSEWLGCQQLIHTKTGETILTCLILDQAALHGLLAKIRDMNLKLLSVSCVEIVQTFDKDRHDSH